MPAATLTPEAKEALRKAVRALRTELISELSRVANGKYELSIPLDKARLSEADRVRRQRLEAWLDEQVRSAAKNVTKESAKGASNKQPSAKEARARFFEQAVKEAASTLLNRLIVLLLLDAAGLSRPAVVSGGWQSLGYKEFAEFAPDLCTDETQGYATLLELLFDELAAELPGLFGPVGLTALFPIPAATLRSVIQQLNPPELACAWTDDTTLGWVYQFWNDPEREALDAKIEQRQKIEPHEIASRRRCSPSATWWSGCSTTASASSGSRCAPVTTGSGSQTRARRAGGAALRVAKAARSGRGAAGCADAHREPPRRPLADERARGLGASSDPHCK